MTRYKVVYSPRALDDLERAWDEIYSASLDVDVTDTYIEELRAKVRDISKYPKTGERLMFEGIFTGIYYVVHKKYSAFYRVVNDRMEVIRVLYNRSNYMQILFDYDS